VLKSEIASDGWILRDFNEEIDFMLDLAAKQFFLFILISKRSRSKIGHKGHLTWNIKNPNVNVECSSLKTALI
jgi:hypothetical protein